MFSIADDYPDNQISIPALLCTHMPLKYLTKKLIFPSPDTTEAFVHGSIYENSTFFKQQKQGVLVNSECSFWYI